MRQAIRAYFSVSALFTFARVLPQAVLTPILTSKGLSFSDILIVQMAFTVTALLVEFPAGYLADRYSRKLMYLASFLLMALSYGVVYAGSGLGVMCVAWILYGVASASQSSTIELTFVESIRADDATLRAFHARDRNIILGSSVAAALLSGLVYPLIGNNLYAFSLALFMLALVLGIFILPGSKDRSTAERHEVSFRSLAMDIHSALSSRAILLPVLMLAGTELAITPFFNLWQMILLDGELPIAWFGLVFIAFQSLNILANLIFVRLPQRRAVSGACLFAIALIGIALVALPNLLVALVALLALPLPLFIYIARVTVRLQKEMPARVMSSIGSASATAEAALSMIVLAISSVLLQTLEPGLVLGLFLLVFTVSSVLLNIRGPAFTEALPERA